MVLEKRTIISINTKEKRREERRGEERREEKRR
jgi:hypothetical protein